MCAQSRSRTRATIQDVARLANVVPSTVSHALNGTAPISERVRERVLAAARELNYRPNAAARSLITGRTMTCGMLVADMVDPYFPDIVGGVEAALGAAGYDLLLCNAAGDVERTRGFLASLASKYVDAVIVVTDGLPPDVLESLPPSTVPAVLVGSDGEAEGDISRIAPDLAPGIEAAFRHLRSLGHHRIAVMTDALAPPAAALREVIAVAAWERCGGRRDEVVVVTGAPRLDGGREVMMQLLAQAPVPTALLAVNDLAAIGAIQAATEMGVRVPQRLSVIGIGDILPASLVAPPLTTIALPRRDIGEAAAQLALRLIGGEDTDTTAVPQLPSALVVRRSTAAPPT